MSTSQPGPAPSGVSLGGITQPGAPARGVDEPTHDKHGKHKDHDKHGKHSGESRNKPQDAAVEKITHDQVANIQAQGQGEPELVKTEGSFLKTDTEGRQVLTDHLMEGEEVVGPDDSDL